MNWDIGLSAQVYVLANLALVAGYLAMPWLIVPHLPMGRWTMLAFGVFFIGCAGSHTDMIWDVLHARSHHPPVGWVAASWHIVQAAGTWAAILLFRRELTRAHALLEVVGASDSPGRQREDAG